MFWILNWSEGGNAALNFSLFSLLPPPPRALSPSHSRRLRIISLFSRIAPGQGGCISGRGGGEIERTRRKGVRGYVHSSSIEISLFDFPLVRFHIAPVEPSYIALSIGRPTTALQLNSCLRANEIKERAKGGKKRPRVERNKNKAGCWWWCWRRWSMEMKKMNNCINRLIVSTDWIELVKHARRSEYWNKFTVDLFLLPSFALLLFARRIP